MCPVQFVTHVPGSDHPQPFSLKTQGEGSLLPTTICHYQTTTPHETTKNQSSPGRGGKTFEKQDVFRERAMDGVSVFYHPVLENFGSSTDLARR